MPQISQFAGNSLLHEGGSYEPQRKSNFALVVYNVEGFEEIILSLKSTSVPSVNIAQGGVKHFNETMRYAGSVQPFENQTLVFHDYIDRDTIEVLSRWKRKVFNPETGAIGWARDYKKTAEILLLPPGMPTSPPGAVDARPFRNRVWSLQGVWPMTLKGADMDHADAGTDTAQINLTLSVDRCFPVSMLGR